MNKIRSIRPANWKLRSYSGKYRILIIAYSFFFVLFQFLGLLLDSESDERLLKLILYIVISLGLSFILSEIILRINNKICHSRSAAKIVTGKSDKYYFLACWGIISLLWLPYFLAYYPGIISYDVTYQLFQEIGSYTTDHPLLHTLMLQGAAWIGNTVFKDINAGMAVYTVFQMLATSASAAYMMLFLRRSENAQDNTYIPFSLYFTVSCMASPQYICYQGYSLCGCISAFSSMHCILVL